MSEWVSYEALLTEGYRRSARLTWRYGTTYFWGAALLPKSQRKHVYAIYALCRLADDIVDLPNGQYPLNDNARAEPVSLRPEPTSLRPEPVEGPSQPTSLRPEPTSLRPEPVEGPLNPRPRALSPLPCALSLSKGQTPRLQQAQPTPQLNQIPYQPSLTRHFRSWNRLIRAKIENVRSRPASRPSPSRSAAAWRAAGVPTRSSPPPCTPRSRAASTRSVSTASLMPWQWI